MPRSRAGLILILFIFIGTAGAQMAGRRGEHPVDLTVRVTWDTDRPAQEHFYVQLMTSFGVPVFSGYTDDNGRLGLGQVTGGYYRIHVSGEGIRDEEEQFYVDPNDAYYLETVRVHPAATGTGHEASGLPTVAVTDLNIPKKARKEFDKGNQEANRRNWKAAEDHFQAAIHEYPRYAMAYNNLGIVRFQAGDSAGARDAFQKALDINDHYGQAYVNLGRLLYFEGDNAGAESLMDKALTAEPRNLDALIVLSSAQLRLGKFPLAAENALKVHALQQPGCPTPCLQGAAPVTDHYSVAHYIAGKALELSNKPQEAQEQFRLYLAETPDGPLAAQARAELTALEKSAKAPAP